MRKFVKIRKSACFDLAAAVCAAALLPCVAAAALGEPAASVQADAAKFQASIKLSQLGIYQLHEMQLTTGTRIREYVGLDGNVFAVTWRGPFAPDLHQILGKYSQNYQTAATFNILDHHHLQIRQSDLVLQASGHMRAFHGQAYLPQSIPAGMSAEDIR